jgi:NAD(P)H-hydrate epimerase
MQRIDTTAIEHVGIPRLLLMDHAGLAVARAVRKLAPAASRPVLVCCGMGFNGGDGLAAARHLWGWGYPLRPLLVGRLADLREEPAAYATILQRLGLSVTELTEAGAWPPVDRAIGGCGLIIDALLGIGARGAVREPMASLIGRLNRSGKPIVAVDLPSGLDGDTGAVQGIAVKATVTVALGLSKRGCVLQDGPAHAGSLTVDPITIPRSVLEPSAP